MWNKDYWSQKMRVFRQNQIFELDEKIYDMI